MQTEFESRSEKRENKFFDESNIGHLSLGGLIVYPREIKKLVKDGFYVTDIKPANIAEAPSLLNVNVDWCHAYHDGIPHQVYSYINYIIDEPPKQYITNLAQELFVIAQRANLKPSK